MNRKKYLDKCYQAIYCSLNKDQKEVFNNFIKIGYQTKWAYKFAKDKGYLYDELNYNENIEIEELEKDIEWRLEDYVDHFEVNKDIKCVCGKSLRHEYKLLHVPTNKIMILGSTHLEQHTNISKEDVQEIMRNFREIDKEKKEILEKVYENKDMDIISKVENGFDFPKDMIKQIEVGLPLLDRQIKRLKSSGAFIESNQEMIEKKDCNRKEDLIKKPPENLSIQEIISNLELSRISSDDSKDYLNYLLYYEKSIDPELIDMPKLKKAINKKLGNIGKSTLRENLVEIEYVLKRISLRSNNI